jgi:hypothetical protein
MKIALKSKNISNNEVQKIENEIVEIIDSNTFLKKRIDPKELFLVLEKTNKVNPMGVFAMIGMRKSGEIDKILSVDLTELNNEEHGSRRYTLTHELFHIPGQIRLSHQYPEIVLSLNKWRKKLSRVDFFVLYAPFENLMAEIGVDFGVMQHNLNFADDCYKKYLGYITVDNDRIIDQIKLSGMDYLYHFIVGINRVRWPSYFLAAKAIKSERLLTLGKELKTKMEEAYDLSHPLVKQKLSNFCNIIAEKAHFADDYFPILYGEFGYISLAERLFKEYRELKESLNQRHSLNVSRLLSISIYKDAEKNFMRVLKHYKMKN